MDALTKIERRELDTLRRYHESAETLIEDLKEIKRIQGEMIDNLKAHIENLTLQRTIAAVLEESKP